MTQTHKPAHLCKYDGRTNTLLEERDLVIGREDFVEGVEAIWPFIKYEHGENIVTLKVWRSFAASLLSRPAYIFVLS